MKYVQAREDDYPNGYVVDWVPRLAMGLFAALLCLGATQAFSGGFQDLRDPQAWADLRRSPALLACCVALSAPAAALVAGGAFWGGCLLAAAVRSRLSVLAALARAHAAFYARISTPVLFALIALAGAGLGWLPSPAQIRWAVAAGALLGLVLKGSARCALEFGGGAPRHPAVSRIAALGCALDTVGLTGLAALLVLPVSAAGLQAQPAGWCVLAACCALACLFWRGIESLVMGPLCFRAGLARVPSVE